jgi:hypothetical protein
MTTGVIVFSALTDSISFRPSTNPEVTKEERRNHSQLMGRPQFP